jgi:Glycosyl transferase family 2
MSAGENECPPSNSFDAKTALHTLQRVDPSSALFHRCRELLVNKIEVQSKPSPKATPPGKRKFLTIGMATANDYDGAYFTIQSIRLHHPEILDDVELLVIDNDATGPCAAALAEFANWCPNYRYIPYRAWKSTAVRDLVFREASGDFVLCIDGHVLFAPGSLARLIEYCRLNPDSNDLLQGPLISDALEVVATHFQPKWSQAMFGVWGLDERGKDPNAPPFEIGMQGLGVFGCRREAWLGFNPRLSGFGGEEGYIHEKFRRKGARNLCLPFLRWMHRFQRPTGVPYPLSIDDRIRNYLLIYDELGVDPSAAIEHFEGSSGKESTRNVVRRTEAEIAGPFHFLDAIYCINSDVDTARWENMLEHFREFGIERKVRRFPASDTPLNPHIGRILSHRRIIADARRQDLHEVVVFGDQLAFASEPGGELALWIDGLRENEWQISYLDESAIAYHRSFYDSLLSAIPDDPFAVARMVRDFDENPAETMLQLFRMLGLGGADDTAAPVESAMAG